MRKLAAILLAAMVLMAIGCENKEQGKQAEGVKETGSAAKTPEAKAPGPKTWVVGFSQCTFEDPWRIHMNNQLQEAAAKHPEIKLIIANGENRNDKQRSDVENFIVRGVDALIISPREAAPLTEVVGKAYDRGIPVVVLDRQVLGDKYTTFIGASNLDIGEAAGEYLADKIGNKGKVVEIEGILGATATIERHDGFRKVIKTHPDIEVIYDQPGDYKRSPAKQIMDNALQAFPVINAVYAHNDEMAIGAFLAAKAVGREKGIVFVGIDGQGEAINMIRNGDIAATFVYPNGAYEAIDTVLKVLNGEKVPKQIMLKTTRITKDEHPEIKGF